ncbi:MAG: oxidoreductase [Pelagibacteraceae bacterium]|nr:oxidoreductase [Pelagibacteraceae bacterium]|tara:strand:- start:2535 stop:3596 length:1062 start_codon:yes stop_codon:yes gene_type:complete
MKKIKIGIIGCGRVSEHYKKLLLSKKITNYIVLAVCDINLNKAKLLSSHFKCDYYNSINKMLKNTNFDLIFLLTPSGYHYKQAKYIISKKINVLIEKPTAFFPNEIKKISTLAKKNQVIACTAYQNRFNPAVQFLKKNIDNGNFGKIVSSSVRLRWCRYNAYYNDEWHGTWKMDGGVINQQAIHHIDCISWILGPINKVCSIATKRLNKLEAEDTLVSIVEFKNKSLGTIEATTAARPRDFEASISIVGEKGIIEIGGIGLNKIEKCEFVKGNKNFAYIKKKYSENIENGYGNSHIILINKIIKNILNKKIASPVPVETTIKTCEFVNALYKSNEINKWVKVGGNNLSKQLGK